MKISQKNLDLATLVLRISLGAIFIGHGYQKIFLFGIGGVSNSFASMGVPLAGIVGPCIAVLEFAGGFAILFGLFARVFGALLACDMLGAIIFVHAKNGFFGPKGVEMVFANFAMAFTIALIGAGAYSIDAMLARRSAPTP